MADDSDDTNDTDGDFGWEDPSGGGPQSNGSDQSQGANGQTGTGAPQATNQPDQLMQLLQQVLHYGLKKYGLMGETAPQATNDTQSFANGGMVRGFDDGGSTDDDPQTIDQSEGDTFSPTPGPMPNQDTLTPPEQDEMTPPEQRPTAPADNQIRSSTGVVQKFRGPKEWGEDLQSGLDAARKAAADYDPAQHHYSTPTSPMENIHAAVDPLMNTLKNVGPGYKRIVSYLMGAGAAPPQVASGIDNYVDPDGTKPGGQVKLESIFHAVSKMGLDGGLGIFQNARQQYDANRSFAAAAFDKGNAISAIDAANKAFAQVPGNMTATFAQGAKGSVTATVTPHDGGDAQTYQLGPDQFKALLKTPNGEFTRMVATGVSSALRPWQEPGPMPTAKQVHLRPAQMPRDPIEPEPPEMKDAGVSEGAWNYAQKEYPWQYQDADRRRFMEQQLQGGQKTSGSVQVAKQKAMGDLQRAQMRSQDARDKARLEAASKAIAAKGTSLISQQDIDDVLKQFNVQHLLQEPSMAGRGSKPQAAPGGKGPPSQDAQGSPQGGAAKPTPTGRTAINDATGQRVQQMSDGNWVPIK